MAASLITHDVYHPSIPSKVDIAQVLADFAGLTPVRVPIGGWGNVDIMVDHWKEWLNSDEAEGAFMVSNQIDRMYSPNWCMFYFTHEPTAVAFKIRWG